MEEMLAGEHPYSYSDGDPVLFASPGILPLIKPVPPSGPAISPPVLAPPTPGTPLPPPVVGGGAALVIVGGAVAIIDLVRWGCTGNLGPFTGFGHALGERHYDRDQELPAEMPPCPRPPKTEEGAIRRRNELLRSYVKCRRIKVGPQREAKACPGGYHQTDIYKCAGATVSASVLCCPCVDRNGVSFYCRASVHLGK